MYKKIIFLVLLTFLFLCLFGLFYFGFIFSKISKSTKPVDFEIKQGKSSLEIAKDLKEQRLIRSEVAFLVYLKIKKGMILAGVYELSSSDNLFKITNKLINKELKEWIVTFPEGFNIKDMAERLQEQGIVNKGVFLSEASRVSEYQKNYPFLKEVKGATLEGYLFPNTYRFAFKVASSEIIEKMLDNFKKKTQEEKVDYDTIILASIIEREAKTKEERAKIASVYLNRLKLGMKLEADPTVQYALGSWDKITTADYKIESPYNTYKYFGLPPGPICNPGLESILAVLNPENTDYLYFFHTENGEIIFSKTLQEHEQKKKEYLN